MDEFWILGHIFLFTTEARRARSWFLFITGRETAADDKNSGGHKAQGLFNGTLSLVLTVLGFIIDHGDTEITEFGFI
ncbi:hypothetical protein JCM14469_08630 [Desulfatiferula olefinivorans]